MRVLTGGRAPLVSVVMAVHNGAEYIGEAIASVLAQRHEALELIVVDDGSTDATVKAVRQSARRDRRVKLVERGHVGQPLALNEGIAEAGGSCIARIDHDDLWHRDHLAAQLEPITNGGVDVCGSWVRQIGDATGILRFPCGHEAIRYEALFACPILDGATLYRTEVLREHPYPPAAIVRTGMVQLLRLLPFYRFGNVRRILTEYRFHATQKTRRLAALAVYRQRQLQEQHFAQLVPDAGPEERAAFALAIGTGPRGREQLLRIADLFTRRLRSPDVEARQRVLRHWRRLVAEQGEPGTGRALRHRLDEAFLA